jgi:hypothetical protein
VILAAVGEPSLVHRDELVVALDYGQFYLHTADNDPELAVTLLEQAQDSDGIAQTDGLVVVESPHQNNFAMPLTVEVWDGQPADDLDQWQEAFEAHLEVTDQLVYESPTMDLTDIAVPPGSYHALISGHGFVTHGWPDDTEPRDEWRIRLWPSPGPEKARRLRAFSEPDAEAADDEAAEQQRAERARLAGLRIKADLDHAPSARALSGKLATAVIDTVVPGKIARFWFLAANLDIASIRGVAEPAVGNWFSMSTHDEDKDPITGTDGQIHCQWTELDDPTTVAMSWQWLGPEGHVFLSHKETIELLRRGGHPPPRVPRLATPSTLAVQFTDATIDAERPTTRIRLEHGHVPVEWVDDLVEFWNARIDIWVWQAGYAPNWRGKRR